MPMKKTPPHKTLVRNLLSSGKLSEGEQQAFSAMVSSIEQGSDLSDHQKLWVETLNDKYLKKTR